MLYLILLAVNRVNRIRFPRASQIPGPLSLLGQELGLQKPAIDGGGSFFFVWGGGNENHHPKVLFFFHLKGLSGPFMGCLVG